MADKAKGKRPAYAADPQVDRLVAMVMALAGEVSVLRERLDTVERLAAAKSLIAPAEIEGYVADETVRAEREAWRAAYLDRVLWSVRAGLAEAAAGETPQSYARAVSEIAGGTDPDRAAG